MAVPKKTPAKKPAAPAKRRSAPAAKKAPVRRRAPVRKKGMLSEMFNPAMAQAGFKSTLSGAMGGGIAALMDKFIPAPDPNVSALYKLAGGFVMATMGRVPNVGAGIAGVGVYQLIQNSGMLNDDSNVSYAEDLELLPIVMNDDGSLQDFSYLNDYNLQDGSNPGFSYQDYPYSY